MPHRDSLRSVRNVLRRFTTPLLPDDYTHLVNPLWTTREVRGRIVDVTHGPDNTTNLTITPGWGMNTRFSAGQYIGIGVAMNGRYVWRSYSLTDAPRPGRDTLSVTVKAIPHGRMSNHLHDIQPGRIVRLAQPAGEFVLPTPLPPQLLFLAAGSGITPIVSMLRFIRSTGSTPPDIALVYCVRNPDDVLFSDDLNHLRSHGGRVHLHLTATSPRLTPDALLSLVPDAPSRSIFIAGSSTFTSTFATGLREAGANNITTEQFTLERTHTTTGGTVTFENQGISTESDGATSILESAESVGVQLPFGCRMGICQTCVQSIADGYVQDLRTGETKGPGERVRTCVCVPAGDVRF